MALHYRPAAEPSDVPLSIRPQFAARGALAEVPRFRLPDGEMFPEVAYQVIHDELMLDGNARLNLATFVTTWMEPQARLLMAECADKNMIDKDEYPMTAELEMRCVSMIAELWNAPEAHHPTGCSTTGSSEAAMLAGLAMKWIWRGRQKRLGRPTEKPNMVMGANVQVCWEKFCRYWDVEARLVPVGPETHMTAEGAVAQCDENTIGVVTVMGSTYDGVYEPVEEIASALDRLAADRGIDVPLHVDAASGGFVTPFLDPELPWDFRLERVVSINASGHKFGLVYPGVGWVVWRDDDVLPDDLVFRVNYLGGEMPTLALNFSRPGAQVVAQYFNFLRLGRDGYTRVQQACRETARRTSEGVAEVGPFELVSDGTGIPVFAFKLKDEVTDYTVFDVSEALRVHGWLVPAYTFPADLEDLAVLRVVVRNGVSRDLGRLLVDHLHDVVGRLERTGGAPPDVHQQSFHH